MSKIKWGIIGPGIIANEFAHDFQFVSNAQIHAVASRNDERGKAFAEKYNIPNVYTSYEALYNDPQIDAVYVATPHNFHLKNSSDAINAGKAVLCEKPITINPAECQQLTSLARERNIYLMEGMWTYFLPAIQKAQEWINNGKIGRVVSIKSDFGYPVPYDPESRMYNPALSGGSLLDMGVYTIAMAWLIYKQDPLIMKVVGRKAPTGVDNDVNMLFEYKDEIASLHSSFRSKLNNHTYIIGEEGYIDLPDFWKANECLLYKGEKVIDTFDDGRKGFGFQFEIEAVSDDLLNGKKESEIVPFTTSLALQRHMEEVSNHF